MSATLKTYDTTLNEIISFSYPKLYTGKEWYVGFYAFDPLLGKMHRKKIKINHIEKKSNRRDFANGLIHRLIVKLNTGWNPWIEAEHGKAYHLFDEVCDKYKQYILKMFNEGVFREETYTSYLSYIHNIIEWNKKRKTRITYIYQFDAAFIDDFIEHIFIERGNSAQTRNNYLGFIRIFSSFYSTVT